jgi:regulator of protease activity HflC (stomatin/prohibitin superfamily)
MRDNRGSLALQGIAVLLAIGLVVSLGAFVFMLETVDEGNAKVVKDKGAATGEVFEPGWHFIVPFVQSTENVDIRPQTYTFSGNPYEGDVSKVDSIRIITGDGQKVYVSTTVQYEVVDPVQFHTVWNNHGKAVNDLIRPTVDSVIRTEGSSQNVRSVISSEGRESLATAAEAALEENLNGSGMKVNQVQVRATHLNPELEQSFENIEIANAEAEQRIIDARAEEEATRIRGQALRENPEVIQMEYIEKLDESDTIYVPTGSNGMPTFIDATSQNGDNQESTAFEGGN